MDHWNLHWKDELREMEVRDGLRFRNKERYVPNYRERLETVEAVQYHHPRNPPPMVKFEGEELEPDHPDRKAYVLSGLKNRIYLKVGDFIVTDPAGGYRVIGEHEFNAKFEEF